MISIIVAASENNAIGKNNQLLWHLPNDLKYFKNITWGGVVVMGRKTFESVGKPLPGRINIVITQQEGWNADGVIVSNSIEDAVSQANKTQCKEIFIIGGGQIYLEILSKTDRIYLTRVHTQLDADTFFPNLDEKEWSLSSNRDCPADEKNKYHLSFQVWDRIST